MTLASTINRNPTTPAAPSGHVNLQFQNDGGTPTVNWSAYDPLMVGDSGSGGTAGNVPAPPSGSAAAGKFLNAGATWTVPAGAIGGTFVDELVTVSGTSGTLSHTPVSLIGLYKNGQRLTALTGSPDFSLSSATLTLTVAGVSTDVYEAVYLY